MKGHLNSFLALEGGDLNKKFFKNSNARGLPGGMLKLRFDWYINMTDRVDRFLSRSIVIFLTFEKP